jgi:hypothetical protein
LVATWQAWSTTAFPMQIMAASLNPHTLLLTSVCFFFARKFNPDALEPLLDMATEVMGNPP